MVYQSVYLQSSPKQCTAKHKITFSSLRTNEVAMRPLILSTSLEKKMKPRGKAQLTISSTHKFDLCPFAFSPANFFTLRTLQVRRGEGEKDRHALTHTLISYNAKEVSSIWRKPSVSISIHHNCFAGKWPYLKKAILTHTHTPFCGQMKHLLYNIV